MYKVIEEFRDNDNKLYSIGDVYENEDKGRIKTLSTKENKYGYPFIEAETKKRIKAKNVETE